MIRLGLRLTLSGGREALVRLIITAAAVALGVGMLLTTVAGINAVNKQNSRYAWVLTGGDATARSKPSEADPLLWHLGADFYEGKLVGRVDVAATGPNSPVPPGIPHLPGPGEFYASPAMSRLLDSTPANQLAARFPGKQVGTVGAAALPGPDTLVVIVGHTSAEMIEIPGVEQVTHISTTPPSACNGNCAYVGIDAAGIDLILSIAIAAMLFPVLIFIGTAARMSAARREQRFAGMRLVGATPRQVSWMAAVESTVSAVFGVAAGFGLFAGLRVLLAPIPFTGERFYLADLSLRPIDILVVVAGVPICAVIAARIALRRVQISPLGVTRRVTPRPPRAWRLIPVLVGLAELNCFAVAGRPKTTTGQIWAFTSGIMVVMAGLVIAGPWLTMICARVMADRATRPAGLVAARRLADNPHAGFRAVSGLVLALFVASVATGVITSYDANRNGPSDNALTRSTLVDTLTTFTNTRETADIQAIPENVLADLRGIPGVSAITVSHAVPETEGPFDFLNPVVACAQLAKTPALGVCPPGVDVASQRMIMRLGATRPIVEWQPAGMSEAEAERLPIMWAAVATDGSTAALEQARTVLERAFPGFVPTTPAEDTAHNPSTARDEGYQRLAQVVILVSLVVAGCSLAASVSGGLNERKRPFALLRLTGAPLGTLRRVVALETVVPLLVASVVSVSIGFLSAWLFLHAQLNYALSPPGLAFYLVVTAGLACSLAVIASTMPLLARLSGPETARSE